MKERSTRLAENEICTYIFKKTITFAALSQGAGWCLTPEMLKIILLV